MPEEKTFEADMIDESTAEITTTASVVVKETVNLDDLLEEKLALKNNKKAMAANMDARIAEVDAKIALVRGTGVKSKQELASKE